MKSSCNAASCETNYCSSGSVSPECNDNNPAKCFNAAGSDCPIEASTQMWAGSFGDAMRQAQVDLLKKKIVQAWGPMMEKAADALVETMGAVWEEKVAKVKVAEAKSEFQNRMRDLWLQENKK